MHNVTSADGATITFEVSGAGPPLVLVHGSLTNRNTNWFAVKPAFAEKFTVYAIDRRGRGETSATQGHTIQDEFEDVVAVIRFVGEPVFLLGHSYGAQTALGATVLVPGLVRKLVLYEPPWPGRNDDQMRALEGDAARRDWEGFVSRFLHEILTMPKSELDTLKATPFWPMLVAEAEATLGDFHAFWSYKFKASNFASLSMPVLLLYGTKSPPQIYVTDALLKALPNAQKVALTDTGHDAVMTDPQQFTTKVNAFLLG